MTFPPKIPTLGFSICSLVFLTFGVIRSNPLFEAMKFWVFFSLLKIHCRLTGVDTAETEPASSCMSHGSRAEGLDRKKDLVPSHLSDLKTLQL